MTSFCNTRIAVVIVNYRSASLVIKSIPSLVDEIKDASSFIIVIVDNASPEDGADVIEDFLAKFEHRDAVRLVRSARNGGFAAGNNIAFATLRDLGWAPDAVLMLNPDARVRPGAVREMAHVLETRPRAGAVGARLENPDGTSWIAAFNFPNLGSEFAQATGIGLIARRFPVLIDETESPVRVDWVSGAAVLLRAAMIENIGGMDEGYFLYFEEVDFFREAARRNWETWHAPAAKVLHIPGSSTGIVDGRPREGRMPAYWFDSWRRYFVKNHGPFYARATAAMKLAGLLIRIIRIRLQGKELGLAQGFVSDFMRTCLFGRFDIKVERHEN